ncbi:hypothetical protein SOPP22_17025 [Shewanella sp. OPT22]|nr:hypothetical protein SOPP22_17025 [Shewanella sp. OPT22]
MTNTFACPYLDRGATFTQERFVKLLEDTPDCFQLSHNRKPSSKERQQLKELSRLKSDLDCCHYIPSSSSSNLMKRFHIIKQLLPESSQKHLQIKFVKPAYNGHVEVRFIYNGDVVKQFSTEDLASVVKAHSSGVMSPYINSLPHCSADIRKCTQTFVNLIKNLEVLNIHLTLSEKENTDPDTEAQKALEKQMFLKNHPQLINLSEEETREIVNLDNYRDSDALSSWRRLEFGHCRIVDFQPLIVALHFSDEHFFITPNFNIPLPTPTSNSSEELIEDYTEYMDKLFNGEFFDYRNFREFLQGLLLLSSGASSPKESFPVLETTPTMQIFPQLISSTKILDTDNRSTFDEVKRELEKATLCGVPMSEVLKYFFPTKFPRNAN